MTQVQLKEKILNLEAQLRYVKRALTREPDFSLDEENWRKVKPQIRKTRKSLYARLYGKK